MSNLSRRIRGARMFANRSQTWLAQQLGVSSAALSRWEKGVARPTVEHLRAIAAALNISVDVLLGESSESNIPRNIEKELSEATTIAQVKVLFSSYVKSLGFDNFSYFMIFRGDLAHRPPAMLITDVSAQWQSHYTDGFLALRDPCWAEALNRILPIFSDEVMRSCVKRGDDDGVQFLKELAAAGYPFLGMFPTFGPCCHSVMAISVKASEKAEDLRAKKEHLAFVSSLLHETMHRVIDHAQPENVRPYLRYRERELMNYVVRGLSLDKISQILNISKSAVRQRVNRLQEKLRVENRQELILMVLAQNLISHDIKHYRATSKSFVMHRLNTGLNAWEAS